MNRAGAAMEPDALPIAEVVRASRAYWVQVTRTISTPSTSTPSPSIHASPRQVPADAAPGSLFTAAVGFTRQTLTVPPNTPAGSWIVVHESDDGAAGTDGPVVQTAAPVVVEGVLVGGATIEAREAASPLEVMRGALAQAGPLWDAGESQRAERLLRTVFDELAARDEGLGDRMRRAWRSRSQNSSEPPVWTYRRVFDQIMLEERGGNNLPDHYLYFWDTRE